MNDAVDRVGKLDHHAKGLSRRSLLQGAALGGATAALNWRGAKARSALAQELSGEITLSFADVDGIRPPYYVQALKPLREANPNATINIDYQEMSSGEFTTRFFLAARSGNVPDVFHLGGAAIGALAESGLIRPLDDLLASWPDWKYYPQRVREAVTYNDQIWALPYGLDTCFLYYRKDSFEQAGLPREWAPANVGGILDAAASLKERVPEVIPYGLYGGEVGGTATAVRGFLPLLWAYGGELLTSDGKWIIDSPAIRKAFAYYSRAFQEDEVVPQQVLTTPNPSRTLIERFGKGELAMLFEGSWAHGTWRRENAETTEQEIGYVLFPTEHDGPSFTVGGAGNVWYMSAKLDDDELAWATMRAINGRDVVAGIDLADPHPLARSDAADLPAVQADTFLADATAALAVARFAPPSPAYLNLIPIIQKATG
ncbi:MAG: extracellular solute-binding protein, partial [Chloroflexota bacterium]|nr:extracellular solute-binding protein [Chloroflexota bacterium]